MISQFTHAVAAPEGIGRVTAAKNHHVAPARKAGGKEEK